MNSVCYRSSDSCQMALPEGMEVQASYLTTILAEEGFPPPEIEKNMFVLKCCLCHNFIKTLSLRFSSC